MIFSSVEGKKTRTGRSLKVWFFSDREQGANVAAFLELKKSGLNVFDSARKKNVLAKGLIVVFRIVSIEESVGFFSDREQRI